MSLNHARDIHGYHDRHLDPKKTTFSSNGSYIHDNTIPASCEVCVLGGQVESNNIASVGRRYILFLIICIGSITTL